MKRNGIIALSLVLCLSVFLFSGCSKQNEATTKETSSVSEAQTAVTENVTTAGQKTQIDLFFERCGSLSQQSGKQIRTSSDVWSEEALGDTQVKYTSLGSSVVNTVLFDQEKNRILSVSSSLSTEDYADEALRTNQIYNVSVLAAAMINGDNRAVSDISSDFNSVIESGIEMYPENLQLSLVADEKTVSLIAQPTVIID